MGAHPRAATAEGELEKLFVEESPKMWRSLLAYSRDPEIASDAVAEAFALALESSDRIASPAGWLWRVAFRTATAELKRRRRIGGEVPERASDWPAPAAEMLSALGELSPRQRGAIVVHYYADRPVKEVARILGSTPPAVRVHLMRGRKRLREILERGDD
jgi:RNA polymerase sigma-70 factor, ECF subfamily